MIPVDLNRLREALMTFDDVDKDFMCMTHGQTVPHHLNSCEYDDQGDCRYSWVALVELPPETFMEVPWAVPVKGES